MIIIIDLLTKNHSFKYQCEISCITILHQYDPEWIRFCNNIFGLCTHGLTTYQMDYFLEVI